MAPMPFDILRLIRKVNKDNGLLRPLSDRAKILKNISGHQSHLLSRLYQLLLRGKGAGDRAKGAWEKDLEEHVSWEEWGKNGELGRKISRNTIIK